MMGGFGNAGIGLAKMMEGVSGGAVAGKQMEYQDKRYQEQREDKNAYNQGRVQSEASRLSMMAEKNKSASDLAAQRIEMEKRRADISVITSAYNIAKDSPNPKDVFKSVQERLNPGAPLVEIDIDDKSDMVSVSYPGSEKAQGWKLKGKKADVNQVLGLIEKNPNATNDIMKNAVRLGIVEASALQFKPVKKGGASGSDGEVKPPKVSDFWAAIKSIGAKYSVDTSGGLVVGADGAVSVNPSAMMGGKTTAYNAIKKLIRESADPAEKAQAQDDLKKIDYYYGQIDKTLGAPSGSPGPGGVSKPKGSGIDEKAIKSTIAKWKKAGYNVDRGSVIAELKKRGKL